MPSARASADLLPLKNAMASDLVIAEPHYELAHMSRPIGFGYGECQTDWVETHADRIRRIRKSRKLTQVELAAKVGVDQSTLSGIENGAMPSADNLLRLADALVYPPEYLMRGVMPSTWPFQRISLERLSSLSPDDLSYVEGFIESALALLERQSVGKSPIQAEADLSKSATTDTHQRGTTSDGRLPGVPLARTGRRAGLPSGFEVDRPGKAKKRGSGG